VIVGWGGGGGILGGGGEIGLEKGVLCRGGGNKRMIDSHNKAFK